MRTISRSRNTGFTLVELMVVLVIAGILAAIAYPAYTGHMQRSRRSDAIAALTAVMQAQERYRGNQSQYATSLVDINVDVSKVASHYQLSLTGVGNPPSFTSGYVVTATPLSTSPQATDIACKTLTMSMEGATPTYKSTGDPGNSGSDSDTSSLCWPK
ncbi:MAG: type IV pilin protein [Pelomonas sp.]|nr:type IV pilin protein [Roseateles sp.]